MAVISSCDTKKYKKNEKTQKKYKKHGLALVGYASTFITGLFLHSLPFHIAAYLFICSRYSFLLFVLASVLVFILLSFFHVYFLLYLTGCVFDLKIGFHN